MIRFSSSVGLGLMLAATHSAPAPGSACMIQYRPCYFLSLPSTPNLPILTITGFASCDMHDADDCSSLSSAVIIGCARKCHLPAMRRRLKGPLVLIFINPCLGTGDPLTVLYYSWDAIAKPTLSLLQGNCKPINIVCDALQDYQIDWDCVFGPESLEEVFQRGGDFTTCPGATKAHPCSSLLPILSDPLSTMNVRFIVDKDEERSEVKVQEGPEGFPFLYGEEYIFKYSFQAIEDMQVATRFTHLGQLKGSAGGYMIKGDPIYSLTANKHGLHVRFSNLESIEDYHDGLDMPLDWDAATGEWVHVEIITTFGQSMEVNISGAVSGTAVWPSDLKPVAWHRDSEMVRMKLGLYHSIHNVADQEVIYQDISIEGPNGIIRTSPHVDDPTNTCPIDSSDIWLNPTMVDITCAALSGNTIDWECVFGYGSLVEVEARGGTLTSCSAGTKVEPCSRFIVPEDKERAEVLVQQGVGGFQFAKGKPRFSMVPCPKKRGIHPTSQFLPHSQGETYIFKYSFKPKDGMKVSGSSSRLGQMKGVSGGFQLIGNPLFSITANNDGINVRFNNDESDIVEGMDEFLSWEDATGEWVNVEIQTTFGKSMEVLGDLYIHPSVTQSLPFKVADAEVEYKNISIQGPTGTIRTSALGVKNHGSPEGVMHLGCVKDSRNDRLLDSVYRSSNLTTECWCGSTDEKDDEDLFRHGSATCEYPCAGDEEQTCGGYWAISLYEYGSALATDIPEGSRYLGCYSDHRFERALSLKLTTSNDMTHEWCMDFCSEFNAKYFAVQWGRE
ncbi:unnamed protein product [Ectocarpus sp. CCAP 1310/34]|nr:unnamed protein product [Ectocarpus sp. CCAP 1310/34]